MSSLRAIFGTSWAAKWFHNCHFWAKMNNESGKSRSGRASTKGAKQIWKFDDRYNRRFAKTQKNDAKMVTTNRQKSVQNGALAPKGGSQLQIPAMGLVEARVHATKWYKNDVEMLLYSFSGPFWKHFRKVRCRCFEKPTKVVQNQFKIRLRAPRGAKKHPKERQRVANGI